MLWFRGVVLSSEIYLIVCFFSFAFSNQCLFRNSYQMVQLERLQESLLKGVGMMEGKDTRW